MSWLVDISPLITARDECEDTTCHDCPIWVGYCGDMIKLLMDLPRVERKKGKWKYEGCDTYSCPFCGDTHVDDGDTYYFCKVCGADMRGEDDEQVD